MELKRRRGGAYFSLWPGASRDPIGIVVNGYIEDVLWLGTVDRALARHLVPRDPVLLDIEAWRRDLLEPYTWLPAYTFVVGVRLEEGVAAVLDNRKPMLRRQSSTGPDPLGRTPENPVSIPDPPWYKRTF